MVLRGQVEQLAAVQERLEPRDGAAHEQGFFLPVALHELLGAEAAQQGEGLCDRQGQSATILLWKSHRNAWSH